MGEATIIDLDVAKSVFQAHGADGYGTIVFRKKLGCARLVAFFANQPPYVVAAQITGYHVLDVIGKSPRNLRSGRRSVSFLVGARPSASPAALEYWP